jgi:hypothetical protein
VLIGGIGQDSLSGGDGDDQLDGGLGNDYLEGGSGNDSMAGGIGDDRYVVEQSGDVVIEGAGAGIDTVTAFVSHTLAANVENLELGWGALGGIDGTGNDLNNRITGSALDNRLEGAGGADTLIGGAGNDTYVIDSTDILVELADQGIDTVRADFTFSLATNFENLVLTGTAEINGFGNNVSNSIVGNSACKRIARRRRGRRPERWWRRRRHAHRRGRQ